MKGPAFLSELDLREADDNVDDGQWIVGAPLSYQSVVARGIADLALFLVPEGFHTNLASVPRLPVVYWLCGGRANKPAVLHDYLYSTGTLPRELADAVFREAMEVVGVPKAYRWLMWAGVRLGGSSHYTTAAPAEAT